MKIKYTSIKENKILIFIDKLFRKLGYYIEMECDYDTNFILKVRIKKTYM